MTRRRPAKRLRHLLVASAAVLALCAGPAALAQIVAFPPAEAAVVMYRIWNPGDPASTADGGWVRDPGVLATNAEHYFDHDRSATDSDPVWVYRWGDQIQIVVEVSLPIFWDPTLPGGPDGELLYPNPCDLSLRFGSGYGPSELTPPEATPPAGSGVLDLEDLVVDWIDPANTEFGGAPEAAYANPLFGSAGPNGEPQITTAALELVGPDLDPYTPGIQAPRWTIANGRLASRMRESDILAMGGDPTLPSSWPDFDEDAAVAVPPRDVPCIRWDLRSVTFPPGRPHRPDDPPGFANWRRIVRLVFGATGYPGSRGSDDSASPPTIAEGQYPYVDDPDAFRIGPQPGMKILSTRADDKTTVTDVYGIQPQDRAYSKDPYSATASDTGSKLDTAWPPGYWTVQSVTLTVSPDPATPLDPASYRTIVVPMYPKAPWPVPDPTNLERNPVTWDYLDNLTLPELARNWFVVEHPLDVQIARGNEATATVPSYGGGSPTIGSGRFGFAGNPGSNANQRANRPDPSGSATDDYECRYYLNQGNHDFLSRVTATGIPTVPSWPNDWDGRYWWHPDWDVGGIYATFGWLWYRDDWTADRNPDTDYTTDPIRPGWALPMLDLGAAGHGRDVGWVRSGDYRADDGLWISNMSHEMLFRARGLALVQTAPGTFTTTADPQEDGPGVVRFSTPPLRPVVTISADWSASPPVITYATASATDYQGRALPNAGYPSIPGGRLRLSSGERDLAENGLPALPWQRSDSARTNPVSLQTPWSAYDTRGTGPSYTHVFRGAPDTLEPERVSLVLSVPPHQPAMASEDAGDWRRPTGFWEILGTGSPPVSYYATTDPDDVTVAPYSGPGTGLTDYQSGSSTLAYGLRADPSDPNSDAQRRSEDDYMVKVYIDVNGNGRLDLARPDLAEAAYGSGPGSTGHDPYWYRFLYEEPYRSVQVRVKVLPDYEVRPNRNVADFGIYGHADPPQWYPAIPQRDILLESRGNFPLGCVPDLSDGSPRVREVGLWALSPWRTDEAEQGVALPPERLMPNYIVDAVAATTGWSFEPAPAGAQASSGAPFLDGLVGPRNGRPDPGERLGSLVTAEPLAAGTPLGTYWIDTLIYTDEDNVAGCSTSEYRNGQLGPTCKLTAKESPLPPLSPGASREAGKDADAGAIFGPDNANTSFRELGPAFFVNNWDVATATDPGSPGDGLPSFEFGAPNVLSGAGSYGDACVFFSSDRPYETSGQVPPGGAWNIWGQRFDWDWDPDTSAPPGSLPRWRPINPRFVPADEAYMIAGHPGGDDGDITTGGDNPSWAPTPPDPSYTQILSYRHYAPGLLHQTLTFGPLPVQMVIMTWNLEIEWAQDPATYSNALHQKTYYTAVCCVAPHDGYILGGDMGEIPPGFGPYLVGSSPGAKFAPRPLLVQPTPGDVIVDVYIYYYRGSTNQRRLGYLLWRIDATPGGDAPFTFMGTHELPVMTRYGPGGVRLDGLEYARDPYLFPDVWFGESEPGSGVYVWHGGPMPGAAPPDIGVVFSGRSKSFGTEDIFYTRYDPDTPIGAPLSEPDNYSPTNNNTGQIPFPVQTDVELVPLRQEALSTAGGALADTYGAYASARWVDWIYDPTAAPPIGIVIRVAGGPTWGPGGWREDPLTGYLYAEGPDGGREIEVDPTVGMVRFVDETLVPARDVPVLATFTPQTMRLTRASQDSGQPIVAMLPPERVITTDPGVPTPVELPLRMVLLYKRFDAQGRVRLLYETFSMPSTYPSAGPPPAPVQLFWSKVTSTDAPPPGSYPEFPFGTASIPFYVDRPPTHVPLDETAGELLVSAQPVRYVWYTGQASIDLARPMVPRVGLDPGRTVTVDGPAGSNQVLQQVVGPTVLWFMYSSTAEKRLTLLDSGLPSEEWLRDEWGLYGTGGSVAYLYDADWDMYFGVLSPQAIPRIVPQITGAGT